MSRRHGLLYVVATPIGNLADITHRALEILRRVDTIASENVGKTRNLLRHYGIPTRVVSYREENARRMGKLIVDLLEDGKDVALVAEAGTPGVSDPGRNLVDAAWKRGLRVVPVPGASAAVAAMSVAGMDEARFVFEGFLPRKRSRRRERLAQLAGEERLLLFFEAPHRLVECLEDMLEVLGDRQCVIARELTKLHEEIGRGPISSLIARYGAGKVLGEFVIVCEGAPAGRVAAPTDRAAAMGMALEEALALVRGGARKRSAAKAVAGKYGLRSSDVYATIRLAQLEEQKRRTE
jgi:16S rRNA (cytidine1402-2'-O)-methyltransferase